VQTKSERFEMRLDQSTVERVDDWRRGQYDVPSRAEAIRRLVDMGMRPAEKPARFEFSNADKLSLFMICDIYEKLGIDAEFDPKFIRTALMNGHAWGIDWRYGVMFPRSEDEPELVRMVVDILDMWNFIEAAVAKLNDDDKTKLATEIGYIGRAQFQGFDGNNEIDYMAACAFLVEDLDRFGRFKTRARLNSHSPKVARYLRMVRAFEPIRPRLAGRDLTLDELVQILGDDTD
jgi:uncharacterized protein YfbU (UPF0304 family)